MDGEIPPDLDPNSGADGLALLVDFEKPFSKPMIGHEAWPPADVHRNSSSRRPNMR
jgi:hypothetical protein